MKLPSDRRPAFGIEFSVETGPFPLEGRTVVRLGQHGKRRRL
ncbi:MAG: hypothetical protein ACE5F1_17120 [Planctomycetota bacterium]